MSEMNESRRYDDPAALYNIIDRLVKVIDEMDPGGRSRLRRNNLDTQDASEFHTLLNEIVLEKGEPCGAVSRHKWAWIMREMATTTLHHNPKVSFGHALALHIDESRVARLFNAQGDTAMEDILAQTIGILDQKAQDFDWAEVSHFILAGQHQRDVIRRKIARAYYAVRAKQA